MSEGTPRPGGRSGIVTTLIQKVFRLKELDKRIERSLDNFAALDRSLDKLPPGSAIMICDQDMQIAVWKAGEEPARPAVPAEVVITPVASIEVAGPGVRRGLPPPNGHPEAG